MRTPILYIAVLLLTAVAMVAGCGSNGADMRAQLEELERCNRADSLMTNDSLALALTNYFDRHGTPNEQMRAYYILGRTYFDRGEMPAALEAYHAAADRADTTRADCDYRTLCRVHAQTAKLFHRHYQPVNAINEYELAEHFANKGRDTLMAIECFFERAYQYERLGKSDSTQQIAERAARRFLMIGNKERAVSAMTATIIPLLEKGETEKVRTIIDDYKAYSGRVDSTGKVSHGREIFYYKQGLYYLKVNMLDSAEATFRRELSEGNDLNNQIAGRKGLQLLYEKKRIIDSIAKYSREGYCLSDSVYALSESQNIQSLQAMFDYTHHLYIAEQKINKEKSKKIRMERTFFVTFLLLIAISYLLIKKMKALTWIKAQHATITKKYNEETLKNIDLKCEKELQSSSIAKQIRVLSMSNPPQVATASDLKELEKLFEETAPSFHRQIIQITYRGKGLNYVEKNVCMLTKLNIPSAQISRLLGLADGYTSTLKTRLYKKITNNIGTAKEFDQLIMSVKEELYQK